MLRGDGDSVGPLKVVKGGWLNDTKQCSLLDNVSAFKYRLYKACDLAHKKGILLLQKVLSNFTDIVSPLTNLWSKV